MTLLIVTLSFIYAELVGYWLHVLLHSYAIPALSREHMNHHILSYAPGKPQRSLDYVQKVKDNSVLIAGIGPEWFIPAILILGVTIGVEWLIGLSWMQITLSVSAILLYVALLFSVLHTSLHLKKSRLLRIPGVRRWFRHARRLHDIHHHHVTDDGLMNVNYGIAFFGFDRVFGTYRARLGKLNRQGISKAKERLSSEG